MTNALEETFVPLTSAAGPSGARAGFRPDTLPASGNTPVFQAFGQASVPAPPPPPAPKCEPKVSLVNQGPNGQASGIRIECSCGQIVEVECVYAAPPPAPAPVPAAVPSPAPSAPLSETSMKAEPVGKRESTAASKSGSKSKTASGKAASRKR